MMLTKSHGRNQLLRVLAEQMPEICSVTLITFEGSLLLKAVEFDLFPIITFRKKWLIDNQNIPHNQHAKESLKSHLKWDTTITHKVPLREARIPCDGKKYFATCTDQKIHTSGQSILNTKTYKLVGHSTI